MFLVCTCCCEEAARVILDSRLFLPAPNAGVGHAQVLMRIAHAPSYGRLGLSKIEEGKFVVELYLPV